MLSLVGLPHPVEASSNFIGRRDVSCVSRRPAQITIQARYPESERPPRYSSNNPAKQLSADRPCNFAEKETKLFGERGEKPRRLLCLVARFRSPNDNDRNVGRSLVEFGNCIVTRSFVFPSVTGCDSSETKTPFVKAYSCASLFIGHLPCQPALQLQS